MVKKKNQNRVLSKSIREKIAKDEQEKQTRRQANNGVNSSSSSEPNGNLFDGFGLVDLNDNGSQKKKTSTFISSVISDANSGTPTKPKGLTNLGNTCYFNSVMQALSRTPNLREELSKKLKEGISWNAAHYDSLKATHQRETGGEELSLIVSLPEASSLTCSFADFLREMIVGQKGTVTPSRVLGEIGSKCSQFRGRDQQDGHELLRTLLDGIKTDEIKRQRKAILCALNVDTKNPANIDDDTKATVKSYGHASNFTTIDNIFGGYIISTVKCEECESSSQILEAFFDLSLPVTDIKQKHEKNTSSSGANKKSRRQRENAADDVEEPEEILNLIDADVTKLSTKDRKARRVQKKAAKRAVKSNPKTSAPKTEEADATSEAKIDVIDEETASNVNGEGKVMDADNSDVKVGVKVRVSLGRVDVNVAIQNGGTEELDCNVEVNHTNAFGNKSVKYNVKNDNVELSDKVTLSECGSGSDDPKEDTVDTAQSMQYNADSEDEGMSECIEELPEVTKTLKCLTLSDETFGDGDKEDLCRIRTSSMSCAVEETKAKVRWSLSTLSPKPETTSLDVNPTVESCLSMYTLPEMLTAGNKLFCEKCTEKAKTEGQDKKIYTNASKQILIAYPPPILTLHLKRFQADGLRCVNLRKINRFVGFKLELDLSPWVSRVYKQLGKCLGVPESHTIKYKLYAIVEHSGTLRSGHYTAFIKVSKSEPEINKYARLRPFIDSVEQLLETVDSSSLCEDQSQVDAVTSETDGKPSTDKWYHISDSHVAAASEQSVLAAQAYILFYERI